MLYLAYQTHADIMAPVRMLAQAGLSALGAWAIAADLKAMRNLTAAYELLTRAGLTHERPAYGIERVRAGNRDVAVREEVIASTPFGTLLHFRKDVDMAQPRVLVVAPLSGHFSTLLRGLVRTLLPEHEVCITDWHNAREARTVEGRFGFDDYVAHLIQWLETMGPGTLGSSPERRLSAESRPGIPATGHGRPRGRPKGCRDRIRVRRCRGCDAGSGRRAPLQGWRP
jgi:poly(3-hydroxybutyrate) depolymerase